MTTMQQRLMLPPPSAMRTLAKDARGYPIPHILLIDKSGMPQFTINVHSKIVDCVRKKLCAICGKRMADGFWFVGETKCFTSVRGAFRDPPMHQECGEYALRVCPFLAAPSYLKPLDDKKLKPGTMPKGRMSPVQNVVGPIQPERFGFGRCTAFDFPLQKAFLVAQWDFVEWWHNGELVGAPEPAHASWSG
jgi:hypothetical protein